MPEHSQDEVDQVRRRLLLAGAKYAAPAIVALLYTQEAYAQSCMPPFGCMPNGGCMPGGCMPGACMPVGGCMPGFCMPIGGCMPATCMPVTCMP